jgi:hypothetical protein
MIKIYAKATAESILSHEIMPPHRTAKAATAAPPSAPPMDIPMPSGISLMC